MEHPLRILQIIGSLDPVGGGPIDGARQLGASWTAQGHQMEFASFDRPDAPYLSAMGGKVHGLGNVGAPEHVGRRQPLHVRFGYAPRFVPWLREHLDDYDGFVVHGLWNYSTLAAKRVLPGSGKPYLVFPHGALDPWFKEDRVKDRIKSLLWPLNEGVLVNRATAVLFTTEEERRLADGAYWPYRPRSAIVGFGSDDVPPDAETQIAAFHEQVPGLEGRRFLLFLSRLHAKKGADLLLAAFAKVADSHRDLDLVMAGPDQDGLRRTLEAQANALGITSRVHWTGMIEGTAKWGAFRACEAFALTSHSENFGIVVAEAMACAKPVLITDKVNVWREVEEAGGGFVEPDTQAGADRLLERMLALSRTEHRAMSARARACYEVHFRMEATANRLVALLRGETR